MTGPEPYDSPDFETPEEEAEAHWQAAYEAMYGTFEEQAADAVEAEAEAIVAEAWSAYGTDSCIIAPALDDPPEPEADL